MRNKHKIVVTVVAALAVGLITSLAVLAYQGPVNQAEAVDEATDDTPGVTAGPLFVHPGDYATETGKSTAMTEVALEEISLKRGESANIQVLVKHLGGANADQSINVKVLPPIGYILYPPSVGKSTTAEERGQAAMSGNLIPGTIDLATFVTIPGSSQKAIEKASQQEYSFVISIPKDLPDEFVGEAIFVPINIEPTDMNGRAIPGLGTGITVVVN